MGLMDREYMWQTYEEKIAERNFYSTILPIVPAQYELWRLYGIEKKTPSEKEEIERLERENLD